MNQLNGSSVRSYLDQLTQCRQTMEQSLGVNDERLANILVPLAAAHSSCGQHAEAEGIYRRLLDMRKSATSQEFPTEASIIGAIVTELKSQHKKGAALLTLVRRLVELSAPGVDSRAARLELMNCLQDVGQFDEAVRVLEQIHAEEPVTGVLRLAQASQMARLLARAGKTDEALNLLQSAVTAFDDDNASAVLIPFMDELASMYYSAGNMDKYRAVRSRRSELATKHNY
jgi:tetratricopeptide (TPR) repeat protein